MNILLIAMPFHLPQFPSIGLTQIKGRLKELFGDEIRVKILYLNHDFFLYFGEVMYTQIANSASYNGMSDWLFRNEAFEEVEDNAEAYLSRFFPLLEPEKKKAARQKARGLGIFIEKLIADYDILSHDLVGVNATFSVVPGLALFRHIKSKNGQCVTVMGGSGVKGPMGQALINTFPHVDFVCSGYGLVSFPALIERFIEHNKTPGRDFPGGLNSIDGILSKTNTGKVNAHAPSMDIDHVIPLDYDDFLASYTKTGLRTKPKILLETSRGCVWGKCTFCGLNEEMKHFEIKNPEKAVSEINTAIERYNLDIEFVDNVMPRSYIKSVLPRIHAPEDMMLLYEVRADLKDDDCKTLVEANVRSVQPGIESLSTGVLKLMNKGVDALQTINFLRLCSEHGVLPAWNLIIAFPGMTEEMYGELIERTPHLVHLAPPNAVFPVRFDRFSAYVEDPGKYGLDLAPFSMYQYIYPYNNSFLSRIAYHFQDNNYSTIELMAKHHETLTTLVNQWKRRWNGEDLEDFPKLYRLKRGGESVVRDERREQGSEYLLSTIEGRILDVLRNPNDADSMAAEMALESRDELDDALESLERKIFIIGENGKYVNLVANNDRFEQIAYLLEYGKEKLNLKKI